MNEETIRQLQALPRVLIENGITYYIIPQEEYEKLKDKEQECERLKWYLKEIRDDELKTLDIELDEYETHCIDTEYTNIINLVEEALEEISTEGCRYKKDK